MLVAGLTIGPHPAGAHPGPTKELRDLGARIAATPDDVDLRLRRAQLLRRMGHPRDALADLRVASRLDPEAREVRVERGLALAAAGRPRAAEREFDRVLAQGPQWVALHERARLRADDGRLDQARADLDEAIALRATPALILARGRLDERRERLDDAARGYTQGLEALGPAVVVQLALVDVNRRRGAFEQALAAIDELLGASAPQADWLLLRADILDGLGQPASATVERLRALVAADTAVRRRPTPAHRLALARTHLSLGQLQVARDVVDTVLRDAPDLPAAQQLSARVQTLSIPVEAP